MDNYSIYLSHQIPYKEKIENNRIIFCPIHPTLVPQNTNSAILEESQLQNSKLIFDRYCSSHDRDHIYLLFIFT